jgi:hypothetical protein
LFGLIHETLPAMFSVMAGNRFNFFGILSSVAAKNL